MVIRYEFVKSMNRSCLPDPPEPIECNGEFNAERCDGCSEYDECAKEDYERSCDVTHILENMVQRGCGMKNENAVKQLKMLKEHLKNDMYADDVNALNAAIKALEQEPTKEEQALLQKWRDNRGISIEDFEDAMNALQEPSGMTTLEKIRTEIEQIAPLDYPCDKRTPERIRDMAVEIIDKYAEQEPKQPDICPIYDGMCGYPIEFCYECPRHPKQEPCEDAVSRQAVLDAINRISLGQTDAVKVSMMTEEYVKRLPIVQPKPKTGHWIFDEILDMHYFCSECKSMGVDYWDYCPNCGARMSDESV